MEKEFSIPNFLVSMEEENKSKKDVESGKYINDIKNETLVTPRIIVSDWSRKVALIYISFLGFFSLFCYDLPGSLETQIENTFEVESYEFEYLYSMYCFPNIILSYCSGILIDRVLGVKLSGVIVALITLLGQILFTVGGFAKKFWLLLMARLIYGIGGDSIMVVINYYTVLWFEGKGLNFVFGMGMSMARLGTSFVFLLSTYTYKWIKGASNNQAVIIGSSFSTSIISSTLILFLVLALGWETERNGKLNSIKSIKHEEKKEKLKSKLRNILVYPKKYWLLSVVFVSVQTAVLVFVTCSQKLLMLKYNINAPSANHLGSVFNLILALTSPLAGIIVDKIGWNLLIINLSLLGAGISQLIMAFIDCSPFIPLVLYGIFCGILFSCVLPLTSKVVPPSQLGSAFGMTIGLSDLCLAVLNIFAGYLLGQFGVIALCLFYASLFLVGLICGVLLWIFDNIDGGTLQE